MNNGDFDLDDRRQRDCRYCIVREAEREVIETSSNVWTLETLRNIRNLQGYVSYLRVCQTFVLVGPVRFP